jgi:hypothetical protein
MIRGDHVGKNVADLAILGLNAGKDKPVQQNREALAARQDGHDFVSLPSLREDLGLLRMFAAINEADLVRHGGRSRQKASRKQQKVSFSHHRPSSARGHAEPTTLLSSLEGCTSNGRKASISRPALYEMPVTATPLYPRRWVR